jgi:hypothetical protein
LTFRQCGTSSWGAPYGTSPTSSGRIGSELTAPHHCRGAVDPQDRSKTVDPQDRSKTVDPQDRSKTVDPQDRWKRCDPQDRRKTAG